MQGAPRDRVLMIRHCSGGLRATLGARNAPDVRDVISSLGAFQSLGEQEGWQIKYDEGMAVEVQYEMTFASGKTLGWFTLGEEWDELKIKAFSVKTPGGVVGIRGRGMQQLQSFKQ